MNNSHDDLPGDASFDAIVIGAGLGGICAAIALAQRGARVALLEAATFPRHKVCGEFMSPEIRRTFRRLGIENDVLKIAPAAISEARVLVSSSGKARDETPSSQSQARKSSTRFAESSLEIALPRGAIGVSRYALDAVLWDAAARAGVQMFAQTRARRIEKQSENGREDAQNNGGFAVQISTSPTPLHARFVLAAPGRNAAFLNDENAFHSEENAPSGERNPLIEYSKSESAKSESAKSESAKSESAKEASPTRKTRRYVGFKTHFSGARGCENAVELHPFAGGYCGVGEVENGDLNVCLLARYESVAGRSPAVFWRDLLHENANLRARFGHLTPQFPWLATANVSFGQIQPSRSDGVLFCGDAGGYIHPLTGDGMAMAARSGELAASIIAAALRDNLETVDVAPLYERAWRREFGARLKWAARLEPLLISPQLARAAIRIFNFAPILGRRAVQLTRG